MSSFHINVEQLSMQMILIIIRGVLFIIIYKQYKLE